MKKIEASIVADSISPQGHRITTYKVTYPRIIHAEMCRHRILSRNSASSRAIPFQKMLKMVVEDPFIPIAWQKDHKGMQGTEYFTNEEDVYPCVARWLAARDEVVFQAEQLNRHGLTKQLCNRLLEPFMWHTEIITGTEWSNFFELRCPSYMGEGIRYYSWKGYTSKYKEFEGKELDFPTKDLLNTSQAEIHIQAIAELMWDAYNESTPKQLKAGEWHIPFGDKINDGQLAQDVSPNEALIYNNTTLTDLKLKVATARCARISYETLGDNPKIDYEADLKLHDTLAKSSHWSPFEHCAKAMTDFEYNDAFDKQESGKLFAGWCKNFRGWIQYRYLIENK